MLETRQNTHTANGEESPKSFQIDLPIYNPPTIYVIAKSERMRISSKLY